MSVNKYKILHDYHGYHDSGLRSLSQIRYIVLHDMESANYLQAAEIVGSMFSRSSAAGDTTYGIDNNSIQQYMDINRICWGAPYVNTTGVHIEQMGIASWTREQWMSKALGTLDRTAWLLAYLNVSYKWPLVHLTNAQLKAGKLKGIITHVQATQVFGPVGGHTDPGQNYPMDWVLKKAKEYRAAMR
jgi:hypothetical protein